MSERDYIKAKLESAGRTMMMLPATGTRPAQHRSGWPEILREFSDMIEAPKENTKPKMRATLEQMNDLEEVEDWIFALFRYTNEKGIPWVSKAVVMGMLHWPFSERRVFSWRKIGNKMGVTGQTVSNWYNQGIDIICDKILRD